MGNALYRVEVTETRVAVLYILADNKAAAAAKAEDIARYLPAAEFTLMGYDALDVKVPEVPKDEAHMEVWEDPEHRTVDEFIRDQNGRPDDV